jgi:hypothetical protein
MSNKVQTFASIISNPMNLHNFEVQIPGVDSNVTLIVESTTFPAQGKFREISLWFQGEKITYAGLPENGGSWTVRIPESDTGKVAKELHKLIKQFYDQKTGVMLPGTWKDITILSKDLSGKIVFKVVLHGAWLAQKNQVNLSSSTPDQAWKWDYVFVYQWVEDVDLQ